MDFGAAFTLLMQGRKVTREGWPGGSWLELRPGTEGEAAHPVVAWADGRPAHPYQHPVMDLYHCRDWILADLPASPVRRSERDRAVELLERVHFLRRNGERPPGAPHDDPEAETWPPLDRDIEAFLQGTIGGK